MCNVKFFPKGIYSKGVVSASVVGMQTRCLCYYGIAALSRAATSLRKYCINVSSW